MALDDINHQILTVMENGLDICHNPYAKIAKAVNIDEKILLQRLQKMLDDGILKRMGIVVRHHELGYNANAMIVWDIPDDMVENIATSIAVEGFITLCYQRPRQLPDWPYNLFCMIHGSKRDEVILQKDDMIKRLGLDNINHQILFSTRRLKQTGAKYGK